MSPSALLTPLARAARCAALLAAAALACDDQCDPASCGVGEECRQDGSCGPAARRQGEPCLQDQQCSPGLLCLSTRYAPTGVTTGSGQVCARPTGNAGEPCGSRSDYEECSSGSLCSSRTQSVQLDPPGSPEYSVGVWSDTGERFGWSSLLGERLCIAGGSLGRGEPCAFNESCGPGLVCNRGFFPAQCLPPSEPGGPCAVASDCASRRCTPDARSTLDEPECALADPSCDIRNEPSCARWLRCQRCEPAQGQPDGAMADAGSAGAGARDAGADSN